MDPSTLVNRCVEIVQDYNPLRTTPSTQCELFFKKKKIMDKDVQNFVREVFYATDRYQKMLKIVVDGLFDRHSSQVSRLDYTLYVVMTLLTVKKLHEMGFANFRKFILSQTPHKMHTLLGFIFADKNMVGGGWLEEQWALVYDIQFVQDNLIGHLQAVGEEARALLQELHTIVMPSSLDVEEQAQARPKVYTIPEPFNLTANSPKPQKKPASPIYKINFKAKEVPEHVKNTSLEQINRQKEERRNEIRAEQALKYKALQDEGKAGFALASDTRPTNIDRVREEVEAEEARHMNINPKAKPMPKYKHDTPIKRTAAQILRDEALYQKRAAEEAAKLRDFEENLRDEQEFVDWQTTMLAKDEEERQRLIEERRQAMAEASERAQAAHANKIEENKELVKEAREESEQMMRQLEDKLEAELEARRVQAELIAKQREEAVAASKAQMEEEKRVAALQAQKEREDRALKVKKQREEDLRAKKELILQIQAMEKLAIEISKRPKEFDPSTASGVGLLEEMSLSELSERLNLLKIRDEEDRERKRDKILEEKRDKQDVLDAMVRSHEKMREEANSKRLEERVSEKTAAALAAAKKKRESDTAIANFKEEQAEDHKKKRERAMQLARELKAKRNAENFELSSSGGRVDAKDAARAARAEQYARDMEKSAVRREKELEEQRRFYEEQLAMSKTADALVRKNNLKTQKRQQTKSRKDYDKNMHNWQSETKNLQEAELHMKNSSAKYVKSEREAMQKRNKARNQYASDQTERALAMARAHRVRSADSVNNRTHRNDYGDMDVDLATLPRPRSSREKTTAAVNGVRYEPIAIS